MTEFPFTVTLQGGKYGRTSATSGRARAEAPPARWDCRTSPGPQLVIEEPRYHINTFGHLIEERDRPWLYRLDSSEQRGLRTYLTYRFAGRGAA